MNRYPLWKYVLVFAVVLIGVLYSLPNLYGEDPAIQVSALRGAKIDASVVTRVEQGLKQANIPYVATTLDETGAKVRFRATDDQLRAKDTVQAALGKDYTVALNLLPATP